MGAWSNLLPNLVSRFGCYRAGFASKRKVGRKVIWGKSLKSAAKWWCYAMLLIYRRWGYAFRFHGTQNRNPRCRTLSKTVRVMKRQTNPKRASSHLTASNSVRQRSIPSLGICGSSSIGRPAGVIKDFWKLVGMSLSKHDRKSTLHLRMIIRRTSLWLHIAENPEDYIVI